MVEVKKVLLLIGFILAAFGVATAQPSEVEAGGASFIGSAGCLKNHVIVSGDTIYSVAEMYGSSVVDVQDSNLHIKNTGRPVLVGDVLCLPEYVDDSYFESTIEAPVKKQGYVSKISNEVPLNPGRLTTIFIEGAKHCPGLKWRILAGIAKQESKYGTMQGGQTGLGNVVSPTITSNMGAKGPMQHMPQSWEAFGNGGNINDWDDAVAASARHLCEGGVIDGTDQQTYKALRRYYTGNLKSFRCKDWPKCGNWYADNIFENAINHETTR